MELLRTLYGISSPSRKEKKMRKFIKDWIKLNVPGAVVRSDKVGNLYVTKGDSATYPCIVSHMDQVQEAHEKDFRCYVVDGKVFGFTPGTMQMRGLGADDKNGIWVCLQCLKKYDVMKCAFFMGEEIGCVGSTSADMDFFNDCRWVVQCDRKNGSDLITDASGVELCSKDFADKLLSAGFGYKETEGMMTDVMTLKEQGLGVSCVNMSCGYYRPHTEQEITVLAELENCLAFVEWIVENMTDVYPHEYVERYSWKDDWSDWGKHDSYGVVRGAGYGKKVSDDIDDACEIICDLLFDNPDMTDDELISEVQYFVDLSSEQIQKCIESCRAYFCYDTVEED